MFVCLCCVEVLSFSVLPQCLISCAEPKRIYASPPALVVPTSKSTVCPWNPVYFVFVCLSQCIFLYILCPALKAHVSPSVLIEIRCFIEADLVPVKPAVQWEIIFKKSFIFSSCSIYIHF